MSARIASSLWLSIGAGVLCFSGIGIPASWAEAEAIQRAPVESSSIASVGYGRTSKLLEIEFRSGAIYRYRAVPESIFTAFSTARSKGNFFSTQVRGKYAFDKLRGSKP